MIEFNKITWYSKTLAIVLGISIFFLGLYIGGEYKEIQILKSVYTTPAEKIDTASFGSETEKILADDTEPIPKEEYTAPIDTYATSQIMEGWKQYKSPHSSYAIELQYPNMWEIATNVGADQEFAVVFYDPATTKSLHPEYIGNSLTIESGIDSDCFDSPTEIRVDDEKAVDTGWTPWVGGTGRVVCISTRSGEEYQLILRARDTAGEAAGSKILSTVHF